MFKHLAFQPPKTAAPGQEPNHRSFYRDHSKSDRQLVDPEEVMRPSHLPRILLIDDDSSFGKIMRNAAKIKGTELVHCSTLEELAQLPRIDFDVVLMDYDLGAVTGIELTSYLESFTAEEIPVILISHSQQRNSRGWPESIREFAHHGLGPFGILESAFEAHEVNRLHRNMRRSAMN